MYDAEMKNAWRLFDSQFGRQARAAEATWARSLSPSDRMAIVEDLYLTARQVHERAADWHTVESVAWKRTLGERQRFVAALHRLRETARGPTPLADAR